MRKIKCVECETFFDPFMIRSDGLPPIIGFELNDGSTIHICADCIIKMGRDKNVGT